MPLTGNTAKMMVIERLKEIAVKKEKLIILDVGCGNLNLWLDAGFDFNKLIIYGIDTDKKVLEDARRNAEMLAKDSFHIRQAKINELPNLFNFKFDIIISTQVLEHIRDLSSAFKSINAVMKSNAIGLFTLDSGYYKSSTSISEKCISSMYRLKRNLVNDFYLRPLKEDMLRDSLTKARMEIVEIKYYDLDPLKQIHNHVLDLDKQDEFALVWKKLEDILNNDKNTITKMKHNFMALYLETMPINNEVKP